MRYPKYLNKYICTLLIGFSVNVSLAQNDTNNTEEKSVVDLNKISVTDTRIKQIDNEGNSTVISISEEDINESTASNLSQLLKEVSITRGGERSFSTHNTGALQADSHGKQWC